ncbi:hypothetical protein EMA8858_02262 [Emticicia aquatica]|jgi:hypothetical protein|uniref:Uncharacterized protein n=1 Tax=Emticicia aquatica TaxID=1681835 RepID=A0ABN8ESZ0_9BACT|nr:hypothetical protein [Emticicia aquatica]CAH0996132.1 hypothetical protein EMA8858_02262 [Emticicia aquatica]
MIEKKYVFLVYFIMVALEIYGQLSGKFWLVWIFKALETPLLAYYYYENRKHKLEILDKLLLLSLAITFIGLWSSYLFNKNVENFNVITIIYIIELQITLFILSKLNRDVGYNNKNDSWRISLILITAIGFIYIAFPVFTTLMQCLVLIIMVQQSLMAIYGLFRKGIDIAISISIIVIVTSNILSVIGGFIVRTAYDYLWIMSLSYLSKILFVEGVLKTQKFIQSKV